MLLLVAGFGMNLQVVAQTSSFGDPIFKEDFGQATTGPGGNSALWDGVYFRTTPLSYINSLLFYHPGNPPAEYGAGPDNNWGPRYVDDPGIGGYALVTDSRGYNNPYLSDHRRA